MTPYEEKTQQEIGLERLHHREQQQAEGLSLNNTDKSSKIAEAMVRRFKSLRYQRSRFGKRWNWYTNKIGW